MTPRTLAESRFTTGYPIVHYRRPLVERFSNVLMAVFIGIYGAMALFYFWSA